jgi:hypothetical protein
MEGLLRALKELFLTMFNRNIEKEEQYIHDEKVEQIEKELIEKPEPEEKVEEAVEPEPKVTARGAYQFKITKREMKLPVHKYSQETYEIDSYELHALFNVKVSLFGETEFDVESSVSLLGGLDTEYCFVKHSTEEGLIAKFLQTENRGVFVMGKIKKKIEEEVRNTVDKMNAKEFKKFIKEGKIDINFDLNINRDVLRKE